jgi:hypothetical protein
MDGVRIARAKVRGASGLIVGALAGMATAILVGTAVAQRVNPGTPEPLLEATHLPPLLTASSEPVELRYDVYCSGAAETSPDVKCDAAGSVFVRAGETGPFQEIALREARAPTSDGRFYAAVPDSIARSPSGFSYYASLWSNSNGRTLILPAGGAAAPQRSLPLGQGAVAVNLDAHGFGAVRAADQRVAEAAWGSGPGQVGLEPGPAQSPIGGASFDVAPDGAVSVLDEANKRVLRWQTGSRVPTSVPLAINGTLADLSVAGDGTIYVLETTNGPAERPLLRSFTANGTARSATEISERASQLRLGRNGPVALQNPSGQWMQVEAGRTPLSLPAQEDSGQAALPLADGREVVVLRRANEIRAALVAADGTHRAWRVTSSTPIAEVQIAEPIGDRLVVVARVYTEQSDEFVVVVLGPNGVEQRFARDSADWAESAPLSRFRLVGSSLYQLGSTPASLFVDRIDLEVS